MVENELVKKLKQLVATKLYCNIEIGEYINDTKSGQPISVNENFLLLGYINEFQCDGFVIVPTENITGIDTDNDFINYILKEEVICSDYEGMSNFDISSFENVFSGFKQSKKNILVLCRELDKVYIGKVVEVFFDRIKFLQFDVEGVWNEVCSEIRYSDITLISFGDRYVEYFSKYVSKSGAYVNRASDCIADISPDDKWVNVLKQLSNQKEYCNIETKEDYSCIRAGVPMIVSNSFLLMATNDHFQYNGYEIIPIKDITCVEKGFEFINHILKSENIYPNYEKVENFDLSSFEIIFNRFLSEKKVLGIDYGKNHNIFIGRIVELSNDCCILHHFDAEGQWQKDNIRINYCQINRIFFDDRYTMFFYKYIAIN